MRLATLTHDSVRDGAPTVGVVADDGVVRAHPDAPPMAELLASGDVGATLGPVAAELPLDEVRLLAPVPRPGKVLAVGRNYADHAAEMTPDLVGEPSSFPIVFNKQTTAVTGPFDRIRIPAVSDQVDYEGELGIVIGRRAASVPAASAMDFVGGYLVANDVSVRDWQRRSPTFTLGKSFDTHCPLGPWIVTADAAGEPSGLGVRTYVNGALRQDGRCADMIHDPARLIEVISTATTLEPGDVILTGTPAGVGAGFDPPKWLEAGDAVRVEIDGIGAIENRVVGPHDEEAIAARVLVRGLVQGVFFRETMRREADAAGVAGWVRNLGDGRVEARIEGTRGAVDALVQWCWRGPRRAVVTEVEVRPAPSSGATRFEVR